MIKEDLYKFEEKRILETIMTTGSVKKTRKELG